MTGSDAPARVGLLIPSSNTVMEVDFYRHLPSHVTVHAGRMYMEETTPEGEGLMLDQYSLPAARDVSTARPDVIVFGCTSAGVLRGNAYDLELCRRIGQEANAPVVSVIASVRESLRRHNAKRIGVITPYVDALNEPIRASIEEEGVEVVHIEGMGITENFAIAQVAPEEIAMFARDALGTLQIDLIFASCTNFRAMDAIPAIEEAAGKPVVTSNQAALEATMRALGPEGSSVSDKDGAVSRVTERRG